MRHEQFEIEVDPSDNTVVIRQDSFTGEEPDAVALAIDQVQAFIEALRSEISKATKVK